MTIHVHLCHFEVRWKLGRDYTDPEGGLVAYAHIGWGKHSRGWRVTLLHDEGRNWDSRVTFVRETNGKREGWYLQGPVRRIY